MSTEECDDLLELVNPDMKRSSTSRILARDTLERPNHKGFLKKDLAKAQETITRRTTITHDQNFRYHSLIDSIFLQEKILDFADCLIKISTLFWN